MFRVTSGFRDLGFHQVPGGHFLGIILASRGVTWGSKNGSKNVLGFGSKWGKSCKVT